MGVNSILHVFGGEDLTQFLDETKGAEHDINDHL